MDEKQVQFLYDNYAKDKGFANYGEFKSLMSNPNSRKVFFDESNAELGFKDYNDFETTLGTKGGAAQPVQPASTTPETPQAPAPQSVRPKDDFLRQTIEVAEKQNPFLRETSALRKKTESAKRDLRIWDEYNQLFSKSKGSGLDSIEESNRLFKLGQELGREESEYAKPKYTKNVEKQVNEGLEERAEEVAYDKKLRDFESAIRDSDRRINDEVVYPEMEGLKKDLFKTENTNRENRAVQVMGLIGQYNSQLMKEKQPLVSHDKILSDPKLMLQLKDFYEKDYDKKIENLEIVVTPVREDGVYTNALKRIAPTEESTKLRKEKEKAMKLFQGFMVDLVNEQMPDATEVLKGEALLPFVDKDLSEIYQRANKQNKQAEFKIKQLGYTANAQNEIQKAELGDEEALQKAEEYSTKLDNLNWEYPEQRKLLLREVVAQRLANTGDINAFDKDAATIREWKKMQQKPLDSRDIPFINQIVSDLDISVEDQKKDILSLRRRSMEATQVRPQGFWAEVGIGAPEYIESIIKGVKALGQSDLEILIDKQKEDLSARKFIPQQWTVFQPDEILDVETGQFVANPNAGEINHGAIPAKMMNGLSQLAVQYLAAELTGGLISPLTGAVAKAERVFAAQEMLATQGAIIKGTKFATPLANTIAMNAKLFIPSFTMTYQGNYNQAFELFGTSEENQWKRMFYAYSTSAMEGGSEKIGNIYEQIGAAKGVVTTLMKRGIAENLQKLSIDNIQKMSKSDLAKFFTNIANATLGGVKGFSKTIGSEIGEELANLGGEYFVAGGLDAEGFEDRDLLKDIYHTTVETAASMGILGGVTTIGGAINGYNNNSISKEANYTIGMKPNEYRDAVAKMHSQGNLTDAERNDKMRLINQAEMAHQNWGSALPFAIGKYKGDTKALYGASRQFVQARTNELALQKEANREGLPEATKNVLNKQIAKWQKVQEAIIDQKITFDEAGNPSLPSVSLPNMVEVKAENKLGEVENVFVPIDPETGKVEKGVLDLATETPNTVELSTEITEQPNTLNLAGEKPVTVELSTEIEPTAATANTPVLATAQQPTQQPAPQTKRRLAGRLAPKQPATEVEQTEVAAPPIVEEVAVTPVVDPTVEQKKEVAKRLSELAKFRDEQNAQLRALYENNPDPDAWVEPYNKLAKEYNERVDEISKLAGEAYPTMARAKPKSKPQEVAENPQESVDFKGIRNDDFVRNYMNEAEQEAYAAATPDVQKTLIADKKAEVTAQENATTESASKPVKNDGGNSVEEDARTDKDFANENESYRVIVGDEAFNDILNSGVVRTNAKNKGGQSLADKLSNRPTLFPSFSKGKAAMDYANSNENHYIIVSQDQSIQPSTKGRHGKGTTMFPTDVNGNPMESISGDKVKVYKHIGEGKYELVYANGKAVEQSLKEQPKADATTESDSKVVAKPTNKNDIEGRTKELEKKQQESSKRRDRELQELNKKENKNYRDVFDILNINEYSEDQQPRSKEAIELANRHQAELDALIQEKREIQSDAENSIFSEYDLTDKEKLGKLKKAIADVYESNRQALDEGFAVAPQALQESLSVGADNYVAHGMGKTTIANAFNSLINLFSKGVNPYTGRGSLDVAPLAGGVSTGTTSSGNAYMDGAFTLVANRGHNGAITNINQVGGIIVNEGMATADVLSALRSLFPNLVIESTSNTKSLVEQLNKKAGVRQNQNATTESASKPVSETTAEPATETKSGVEGEVQQGTKPDSEGGSKRTDAVLKENNISLQSQTTQNEQGRTETVPQQDGNRAGRDASGSITPLKDAPIIQGATGADPNIVFVAEKYAEENGIELYRQSEYAEVDPEFAKRVADAYEEMKDDPQNPVVKEAYDNLIKQTIAQYDALVKAGYEFSFFDSENDPYEGNPYNAIRDLRQNKKMAVYGTYDGYGTEGITASAIQSNPMLADTGLRWKDQSGVERMVTANDLFRAVHDAFGHSMEGSGFRARGEENAWQAHVRLFTGSAIAAITTETRGQNSWLNFGKYGESNRNAKVEDTVFAEQKTGLMPEWTWTENRVGDMPKAQKSVAEPQLGDTVSIQSKTDKKPIRYFFEGGTWKFTDSRGRTQKATAKEAESVTAEWRNRRAKMLDVADTLPLETKEDIRQYISKAAAVLKSLWPDAKFEVYETTKEYEAAGGNIGSRGNWNPATNTVQLDLQSMQEGNTNRTPVHEVVHPIVRSAITSNPKLLGQFVEDINRLAEVPGMDLVFAHAARYKQSMQAEELVTEFITRVVDGTVNLDEISPDLVERLIELINKIFEAIGLAQVYTISQLKEIASAVKQAFETGDLAAVQAYVGGNISGNAKMLEQAAPELEQQIAEIAQEFPDVTVAEIMEELAESRPELVATQQAQSATQKRVENVLAEINKPPLVKAVEADQKQLGAKYVANIKEQLIPIFEKGFNATKEQAQAAAEIADRIIGNMANLNGITKEEQYRRIAYKQGDPQGDALYQTEAWHGSPYAFERFTTEKIGTGEGVQAFGWGLYFTDLESIGAKYANDLARRKMRGYGNFKLGDKFFSDYKLSEPVIEPIVENLLSGNTQSAIDSINLDIKKYEDLNNKSIQLTREPNKAFADAAKKLKELRSDIESGKKFSGNRNLYKVSLHKGKTPEQYIWLDWDKPMTDAQMNKLSEIDEIKSLIDKKQAARETLTKKFAEKGVEKMFNAPITGEDIYKGLSKELGGDKQASLFLLKNGIDGVKYPAESIARGATSNNARGFNYVVFDENAVTIEERIQFQESGLSAQGAIVMRGAMATIFAMTNPNVTTPLHELSHAYFDTLLNAKDNAQAQADVKVFADNAGVTVDEITNSPEAYTKAQEIFARGFENYLAEGVAPSPELKTIFDKFQKWLMDIYGTLKNSVIDVKLNDAMRDVYARMLTPAIVEKDFPAKGKAEINKKSVDLFRQLDSLQGAIPLRISGETAKLTNQYGSKTVELAKLISMNFDTITKQLEDSGLLKKEC